MDAETKRRVAIGLAKLADAIQDLRKAEASVEVGLRTEKHLGDDTKTLALGLSRVLGHLGEAVADVPSEMWAAMLTHEHIGVEELRKALEAAA